MFGVTLFSFLMLHMAPGDPAEILGGDEAGADIIENIRNQYGLDKPLYIQYGVYINDMLHGNFGRSIATSQEIAPLLVQRLRVTLKLALFGLAISCFIGILAGITSAVHQYSFFDTISMILALIGASMPVFWSGLLLMLLFSVTFQLFPAGGGTDWHSLTLPAISMSASAAALIARMTRGSMLEVLRQDYLRTARANGIKERVIIYKHALKNAMIPVITVIGLYFGYMLAGAVISEAVFAIPGVGTLLLAGIFERDYPVVQSTMLIVATIFVIVNLLTDITYAFFDPRVKYR